MRRTIVVADRDERLQQAFMTVFSREHYDIIYASNGKEVERIAVRIKPDIYVVNVRLPKTGGIDLHKKLKHDGYLNEASFFFLKDEADQTNLSDYPADGIIEKPINFFRLYEAITGEDEVLELTDLVDEKAVEDPRKTKERPRKDVALEPVAAEAQKEPAAGKGGRQADGGEGMRLRQVIGRQLRDAFDNVSEPPKGVVDTIEVPAEAGPAYRLEMEEQFRSVLGQAMEAAAHELSGRLAPVLTRFAEDYVRQALLEVTEKVVREEIDKLLKEPGE